MKKNVSIFLILIFFLFTLTGCVNQENASLEDKNIAELEYIEGKLVGILNKFIRDEYKVSENAKESKNETEENEVEKDIVSIKKVKLNWEEILKDTQKIEDSLAITLVDLAALNIESEEIAKLSDGVNSMITAINNKDERSYLIELNNVYALIPTYMEKYTENNEKAFKKRLKYYTISTYVAYMDGNLEMSKTQVNELDRIYNEKMQDMSYVQNNEYNLNKLYILIQELKRAVEAENEELVKSKYLLTIEEF